MSIIVKSLFLSILVVFLAESINASDIKKLKGIQIDSLTVFIDSSFLRLPGYEFPIAIQLITREGIIYTKGLGGGKVRWSNFKIDVKGGSFSNGKIHVSNKLLPGDYIEVIATCQDYPSVKISKIFRLNYINKMNLYSLNTFQKIPGARFNFGIKVKYDNGCNENITSWNQNYKLINSLKLGFQAAGGEINNNRFQIDSEIDNIHDHKIHLIGSIPRFPYVSDTLGILLDYRGKFEYYKAGLCGMMGRSGSDGVDGPNGSESQDGGYGSHGENGEEGDYGYRGDDFEVFCDAYYDTIINTDLLYVEVKNLDSYHIKKYLINPDGGSINIVSSGGTGGSGGSGGDGGDGGRGGDGRKYTEEIKDSTGVKYETHQERGANGGHGGHGGYGGYGGHGGDGGNIFIHYTIEAEKFLSCIHPESYGGMGGSGGFGGDGGSSGLGGSPGGNNGTSGRSGSNGLLGDSGYPGEVKWFLDE